MTSTLHSLNQSAMLLTSPYLGLDSSGQIHRRGLRNAQPRWLWQSTRSMFPGLANPSHLSPAPERSPPPPLPPNPRSAGSAAFLITLLHYAKKRHKLDRSALTSIIAPPTDVLTKAVRKGALRSLSWDAATPPPLSVSTAVVSTPLSMAPVPSVAKASPLSVLRGTKIFPMPPMRASPKPPLRDQLFTQLYRPLQPGTVLVSLPLANLPNLKPLEWSAVRLPRLASPLASPAGTSLVLAAPTSELAPVPTGASPLRPTSTWIFKMSTSPAPTQGPSLSQSFHYPGCLNLSIVQHNCPGSSNVFQTLCSFFTFRRNFSSYCGSSGYSSLEELSPCFSSL